MAVGAGILAVGLLAGHILTRVAHARRRPTEPEPICGCRDHYAVHDPETGACLAQMKRKVQPHPGGAWRTEWVPCPCRRYVGPAPAETLETLVLRATPGE